MMLQRRKRRDVPFASFAAPQKAVSLFAVPDESPMTLDAGSGHCPTNQLLPLSREGSLESVKLATLGFRYTQPRTSGTSFAFLLHAK
jgi:hypothetical protein